MAIKPIIKVVTYFAKKNPKLAEKILEFTFVVIADTYEGLKRLFTSKESRLNQVQSWYKDGKITKNEYEELRRKILNDN